MQAWRLYAARKTHLRYLGDSIALAHRHRIAHKYLSEMQTRALRTATNHTIVASFTTQRNRLLCTIAISVLANYAKCQQKRRREESTVTAFRKGQLLNKGMLGLKLQRSQRVSKHRYSRLFTIFTSWKTLTKENNLLKKYLAECNYKQKAMMAQSNTIDGCSPTKRRVASRDQFASGLVATDQS